MLSSFQNSEVIVEEEPTYCAPWDTPFRAPIGEEAAPVAPAEYQPTQVDTELTLVKGDQGQVKVSNYFFPYEQYYNSM